ncbi:hypothetical protein GTS_37720 [Gandjariella thermophila]|uniref:Uncharacterized protein n=1 Tax=Gandjariella thermophila TaxID=1931992 RepID=A0A4D4JCP0_9PSEU|nr:hypothetical protein GTS_37720 [Gandjariella thermophila]
MTYIALSGEPLLGQSRASPPHRVPARRGPAPPGAAVRPGRDHGAPAATPGGVVGTAFRAGRTPAGRQELEPAGGAGTRAVPRTDEPTPSLVDITAIRPVPVQHHPEGRHRAASARRGPAVLEHRAGPAGAGRGRESADRLSHPVNGSGNDIERMTRLRLSTPGKVSRTS